VEVPHDQRAETWNEDFKTRPLWYNLSGDCNNVTGHCTCLIGFKGADCSVKDVLLRANTINNWQSSWVLTNESGYATKITIDLTRMKHCHVQPICSSHHLSWGILSKCVPCLRGTSDQRHWNHLSFRTERLPGAESQRAGVWSIPETFGSSGAGDGDVDCCGESDHGSRMGLPRFFSELTILRSIVCWINGMQMNMMNKW